MDSKSEHFVVLNHLLLLLAGVLISSCGSTNVVTKSLGDVSDDSVNVQLIEADQPNPSVTTWVIPENKEQGLRNNNWDLEHQKIWVSFDLDKKQVIGTTELFLTSKINDNNELILDSKTTQISSLRSINYNREIPFVKDSATVRIPLTESFSAGDSLFLRIEYIAEPPNRGLYFVGPTDQSPEKPTQIWTLGQPEDNSFWLPTLDHPAERTTTEQWIRVPENFTTISNGKLIRSAVEVGDSLRTDYWIMDKPHAPYLITIAAGEFVSANQLFNDVVLSYFVEPKYAPYIYSIYKDTDLMLAFFEDKLNYPYPWETYSQVAVRDFIARGMENTTASIYFEDIQLTDRQQQDVSYQDLLVHELIHQWFGNLITTKDWANLPLNEGFANYFETLFRLYNDGKSRALIKALEDRNTYLKEAKSKRRPIIFDQYVIPEDMYDSHTYEKMGLVLRQYHHMIGDELWWEGLSRYLTNNEWNSVNWQVLNQSFLEITGQDHDWYWKQWLLEPGHPEIKVDYDYSGTNPLLLFEQIHDTTRQPIFRLELPISYHDLYGNVYNETFTLKNAISSFEIPLSKDSISVINVDPERIVLAEYFENITLDEWVTRLSHPSEMLRSEAVNYLSHKISDLDSLLDILMQAYEIEISPEIRFDILSSVRNYLNVSHLPWIHKINEDSEDYYLVRILAADISADLAGIRGNTYLESLRSDKSYYVAMHIDNILSQ